MTRIGDGYVGKLFLHSLIHGGGMPDIKFQYHTLEKRGRNVGTVTIDVITQANTTQACPNH